MKSALDLPEQPQVVLLRLAIFDQPWGVFPSGRERNHSGVSERLVLMTCAKS